MTDAPKRIRLSRAKGWRMPANTVKVDRTTRWGNPYRAGLHCDHQHAVDCHRFLLTQGRAARSAPDAVSDAADYATFVRDHIAELRGKNLACWCSLNDPCHAELLLELANTASCPHPSATFGRSLPLPMGEGA
jgi:hypothetical protein